MSVCGGGCECVPAQGNCVFRALILASNGQGGFNLGVVHIGAPACGMNAAVRSFVRNCIYRGDTVYGIHDGIDGLVEGNVSHLALSSSLLIHLCSLIAVLYLVKYLGLEYNTSLVIHSFILCMLLTLLYLHLTKCSLPFIPLF